MKLTLTILLGCVLSIGASSMGLKQAIALKLVAVEVSGSNWDSMPAALRNGFAPKMQITASNLSSKPLEADLGPGYMLEAAEHGYQAMLLTQPISIRLNPHERKRDFLYAMCTQLHNSGPNSTLHYHVAELARPALLQIALFISGKKYLVHAAQEAVWSISDDMPIPSVEDANPHISDDLQNELAAIKHVNIDSVRKEYKENQRAIMAEFNGPRTDRNIPFTVQDSSLVSVGYYNPDGTLLRTIVKPTVLMKGGHSFRYDPLPVAFAGKRYTVRLIKDGSIYKEYFFNQ